MNVLYAVDDDVLLQVFATVDNFMRLGLLKIDVRAVGVEVR